MPISDKNNTFLKQYSDKHKALTFSDVTLADQYSEVIPNQVELSGKITRNIYLKGCPILSAAMDTVTEEDMAVAMAQNGCIGIVHRNLSVSDQVDMIHRIRNKINYRGMIKDPVTFESTDHLSDIHTAIQQKGYNFRTFPIVESEKLVGLITKSCCDFIESGTDPCLSDIMKKFDELCVVSPGTSLQIVYKLMITNKMRKIPVIDSNGHLVGMFSWSDIRNDQRKRELYSLDPNGNFLVGAAVGPGINDRLRIDRLVQEAKCPLLVIDCSHGACYDVLEQVRYIKTMYKDTEVIAGNVCSYSSALILFSSEYPPDAVKVGIGPSCICTTRVVTGHGMPQITAIYEAYCARKISKREEIPIIADGGIICSGDAVKAFAAGADAIMIGTMLAGTAESPGETVTRQNKIYKRVRGMGSRSAMESRQGSRSRYNINGFQRDLLTNEQKMKVTPEGISGLVPLSGTVEQFLQDYKGGIQAGLAHSGAKTIDLFRNCCELWRQTSAGNEEGKPHYITDIAD